MKIYHAIALYTMVYKIVGMVPWYFVILHGKLPGFHGIAWYFTMVYHDLPWFICFKTPWYTMAFFCRVYESSIAGTGLK